MFLIRAVSLVFVIVCISTTSMIGGDQYNVFGSYHIGLTNPSGNLGLPSYSSFKLSVEHGWNIGFDGVFPINSHVGVGFDLFYSLFPISAISSNDNSMSYSGKYKILSIKPSLFLGSFDPESPLILAGFLRGGYALLITPQHTIKMHYDESSTTYSSHIGGGLGVGVGFLCGYKFSESMGISGIIAYDVPQFVEKGSSSGNYLSIQMGLLVCVLEYP